METRRRMLIAPTLISSDLQLLLTKCNCQTYVVNIGLKLKKAELRNFFEHINAPLSGLSWKTEIYRPEDLRVGPFSICQQDWIQTSFNVTWFSDGTAIHQKLWTAASLPCRWQQLQPELSLLASSHQRNHTLSVEEPTPINLRTPCKLDIQVNFHNIFLWRALLWFE